MDFGRVLEAILEGFWMPESMQKSIELILKTLILCGGYCKNEGMGPSRFNRNMSKNSFENHYILNDF